MVPPYLVSISVAPIQFDLQKSTWRAQRVSRADGSREVITQDTVGRFTIHYRQQYHNVCLIIEQYKCMVPGLAGRFEGIVVSELFRPNTIGNTCGHKKLIICAVNIIIFVENKEETLLPLIVTVF
jgi:hypothetical protein